MKAHAILSAKCDISFIRTWWPLTFDSNPSEETCLISQGVSCFPSRYHWSMYASALHVTLYVSCSFTCLCDLKIRDLISCIFLSHHATQVLEQIGFSLNIYRNWLRFFLLLVLPCNRRHTMRGSQRQWGVPEGGTGSQKPRFRKYGISPLISGLSLHHLSGLGQVPALLWASMSPSSL